MSGPRNTAPIDENVRMPEAVRRATERATAIHQQAYGTTVEDAPPANANGQDDDKPQPPPAPSAPPAAPASAAAPPTTQDEPARSEHVEPGSWEARYWAMKGRFDQAGRRVNDQENRLSHLEQL